MCSDLISRQAAIEAVEEMVEVQRFYDIADKLSCLPSTELEERTAKVEELDMDNPNHHVFRCLNCGQYMHRTSWSRPVNFCSSCGMRIDWKKHEDA